jgi:histidinol-phosphate aminotransferase
VVRVGRTPEHAMDLAAAREALSRADGSRVRMVYVAHPNTPTGNLLGHAEIAWLRGLPEHVLVVVDEAYYEFSGETLVADALARPNWVVLRTLSKGFGLAAWRVGYAVGAEPVIDVLERLRLPFNLSGPHQAAGRVVLELADRALAEIPAIRARRDALVDWLHAHPAAYPSPSAANFVHVRVADPERVVRALASQGVIVSRAPGAVRVTIGGAEDHERLVRVLGAVLAR